MIENRQNNEQTEDSKTTKREKLHLTITPAPFEGVSSTKFVTSSDICKAAAEIFKSTFDDCEGTTFETTGGFPTLSVVFNHGLYEKGARVAVSREASVDTNSSIIDRIRSHDRFMMNGDKYLITEDGKDIFEDLLVYNAYNNNNKPNWGKVVAEFSENTQQRFYGQAAPQYTKVGLIDLSKFVSLLWGKTDEEGNSVEYIVQIVKPLNSGVPGMPPSNYMLSVTQISSKELQKTYEKLGLGSYSSIVR